MKKKRSPLDTLAKVAMALLAAAIVTGLFILDFKIWRAEHPTAPAWTYWARGGR